MQHQLLVVVQQKIKIPAAERRGIFVLPESCTSGLIPSVTPQSLAHETLSVQKVLNPTARIMANLTLFHPQNGKVE
ncbi:MAG: hypothetical protein Ta2B_27800 [Termitinemataceae bacterium]|nr:MAG: hypothetical protein Ta2B_27800 [Termitinemataceae bacterium]